jgi:hypothetical protein
MHIVAERELKCPAEGKRRARADSRQCLASRSIHSARRRQLVAIVRGERNEMAVPEMPAPLLARIDPPPQELSMMSLEFTEFNLSESP